MDRTRGALLWGALAPRVRSNIRRGIEPLAPSGRIGVNYPLIPVSQVARRACHSGGISFEETHFKQRGGTFYEQNVMNHFSPFIFPSLLLENMHSEKMNTSAPKRILS